MAQGFFNAAFGWAVMAAPPAFALEQFASPILDEAGRVGVRRRRGKGQNNRRGKGIQAKPACRPNRMHISKRVRRKHRRAA